MVLLSLAAQCNQNHPLMYKTSHCLLSPPSTSSSLSSHTHRGLKINTSLRVLADPPSPLDVVPREALEAAGNLVTSAVLSLVQKQLVDCVAKDYNSWASSADFRRARSDAILALEKELVPVNA